jgi:hypothetical protein
MKLTALTLAVMCCGGAIVAAAQEFPPPEPPAATQPATQAQPPLPDDNEVPPESPEPPAEEATVPSEVPAPEPVEPPPPATLAAVPPDRAEAIERGDPYPNANIYLPEGEFDIRVRKLIKNVLFEGQIQYQFVDGDISTYLRYKYYARRFTYKLAVFDTIEFRSLERSSLDFDRIRGALLLFDVPRGPLDRYLLLLQNDDLSFGDTSRPDHDKSNLYMQLAWQYGTPFDDRLNSIAGERRGRIAPLLTPHRDVGPQKLGFVVAVAHSDSSFGSDFDYTKIETEALKRFDFRNHTLFVTRLHAGTILGEHEIEHTPAPGEEDEPVPEVERYSVPRTEFFRLGGRGYLLAVDNDIRGSEQVHLTNEYFVPLFRDRKLRKLGAEWNDFYALVYTGVGSIAFDAGDLADDYVVDAGVGFEASLRVRDYDVVLSAVYARTVVAPAEFEGDEVLFSVRTRR